MFKSKPLELQKTKTNYAIMLTLDSMIYKLYLL